MKDFIWNSDGLRDPAKQCTIHEAVHDFKLGFVVIFETREKNGNLVYEVAMDVRFGHELTNLEFRITKLPRANVLVTS
jgi:hypothetical protein